VQRAEIIVKELMPNLRAYLAATWSHGVLHDPRSVGLEVLGLGPIDSPTLGHDALLVNFNAALINGWLVVGRRRSRSSRQSSSASSSSPWADEIANPRLRRGLCTPSRPQRARPERSLATPLGAVTAADSVSFASGPASGSGCRESVFRKVTLALPSSA